MSQQTSSNTPMNTPNFETPEGFARYVEQKLQAGKSDGITNVTLRNQGNTPLIVAQTNTGTAWEVRVNRGGSHS